MKNIAIAALVAAFVLPTAASAHVTVKPAEAGVAAFQTFTVGVPVEKDVPTVGVRIELPEGVSFVTPNVKSGWKVEVKKVKTGKQITDDDGMTVDEERATEIVWSGGSIPAGQRDEFAFSAQVPATETTLAWKAYQTYADGSVVSWNQPHITGGHDAKYPEGTGPYSETSVVNDLADASASGGSTTNLAISLAALVISIAALSKARRIS